MGKCVTPDKKLISTFLGAGLLLMTTLSGCDPVFEPLTENDLYHYSLNGLLDASADTQWVRIMPVRETVRFDPEPLDVTVTLEHPASGRTVLLQNTLVDFRGNSPAGGAPAYNFFTSAIDLLPEETYRLTVTGSDGKSSDVTVTLPRDFPEPEFRGNDMYMQVADIDHLADISVIHYIVNTVSLEKQRIVRPLIPHISTTFYEEYRVRVSGGRTSMNEDYGEPWIRYKSELFIASGGDEWPAFSLMGLQTLQLPDAFSNVSSGVGFIAPIVSKRIPVCPSPRNGFVPCPDGSEH